jgi:hypothetical protein
MLEKADNGAPAVPIVAALDEQPEAEALAGALPGWDLVPEAPFLRRR